MLSRVNSERRTLLLIGIVAAIAVIPMLLFGNSWGQDFDLHVPAWMEAAQQLRTGTLYPRWAPDANHGFGEPFFVFYPPLSWTLGATLGLVLPWKVVPGVYVWMALALGGAAMWKCAKQWLDRSDAVMASLLYTLNPYQLVNVYKRCNYAELLASALFPLLVWGAIRMGRDARKTVLPLAIVLGAVWLADLPAAVVASYSLALLLLLDSIINGSLRPILYGALAILAAFGGIAVFLVPAAWEQKWVNIGEALRSTWLPENNFLFAQHNAPTYLAFNRGLSFIALFLVIVAAIAVVLTRRLRRDAPDVWRLLTALGAVSTFMMLPPSLIFYRILPEMRFVGFPTRWLSPLCVVVVLLTSSAVGQARRKWILWMGIAFVVAALGAGILRSAHWNSQHLQDLTVAMNSGRGFDGIAWCSPLGSQPSKLPQAAPLISSTDAADEKELSRQGVQVHVERWSPEQKLFSVDSPRPLLLKIKLLTYPAWQAKLNGRSVPLGTEPETGQMLLPLPAGISQTEIRFVQTWDRTLGMIVSFTTLLLIVLLILFLRRR